MNHPLSPFGFISAALLLTAAMLIASLLLPHNRYFRWQELETQESRKADWVYERLHFDDTKIDVALIGTSRTAGGISGPDLEREYCKLTGRRIHIANLGLPGTGRSLQYVVAKEVIKTKSPALLLVEINESETRQQHKGFITLADASDVLAAPLILNLSYFSDIANLPGRQVRLFVDTILRRPHVKAAFDPAAYLGHDLDNTRQLMLLNGTMQSRSVFAPKTELDAGFDQRRSHKSKLHLMARLRPLEYRVSRLYLRKIERLEKRAGGNVEYLFIPSYRRPVVSKRLLNDLEINALAFDLGGEIAKQPEKWRDVSHVNTLGAIEQTARLAEQLARRRPDLGVNGCGAPRAVVANDASSR